MRCTGADDCTSLNTFTSANTNYPYKPILSPLKVTHVRNVNSVASQTCKLIPIADTKGTQTDTIHENIFNVNKQSSTLKKRK